MRWLLLLTLVSPAAHGWTLLGDIAGWQPRHLEVVVNPTDCPLDTGVLMTVIDEALHVWNGIPTTHIDLYRAVSTVNTTPVEFKAGLAAVTPVILCDTNFSTNTTADPDFVPAATRASAPQGTLVYGGVILNAEAGAGANIANLSVETLRVTLAHELGHVLGLGHSSSSAALMYYSISGKAQPVLSQDDMDALTYLYPRQEFLAGAFGCGAAHPQAGAWNPWGPVPLLLVVLLILAGRWLRPVRLPSPRE